jgi:hypothetical protein
MVERASTIVKRKVIVWKLSARAFREAFNKVLEVREKLDSHSPV